MPVFPREGVIQPKRRSRWNKIGDATYCVYLWNRRQIAYTGFKIFNLTTLHDTRIAVEQNKNALNLTISINRVSTLTFFHLPLTFVCVSTLSVFEPTLPTY